MTVKAMSRAELTQELQRLRAEDRAHHELRVHQVELELQNRELREAQGALEQSRARFEELYDFAPLAYFTFDIKGCIQEVNLTGATMVEDERSRLFGMPFLVLVKTEDQAVFWAHLRRCALERKAVVSEMRFSTAKRGPRVVQLISAPVLDSAGQIVSFRTSFTDISRLKEVEAELARASENEKMLRQRFEGLDQASLELNHALTSIADRGVIGVFQVIVDRARIIAGAEFAALGLGEDVDQPFSPWTFSGMPASSVSEIGLAPRPRGLLGVPLTGQTLRLRDLREHPAFVGFPPHHPQMTSFLGVSIRFGQQIVGNLYLANKRSAPEFSDDDQRVVEMLAERAGVAIEIASLWNERTKAEALLRAAIESRDHLLAAVSHDLRSPLSAIQLSAEMLAQRDPRDERRRGRKQVDAILRSTQRMSSLVGDLLQAAMIEAGTFSIHQRSEDAMSILEEAVEALDPMATARSVDIELEVPCSLPAVQADRRRLIQVLSNLIGNAVRLVPERGTIHVRAEASDGGVRFSVSDNGPGIGAEQMKRLFDRYWQGNSEERGGAGLGLYIAKGIVEAHGGRIWAQSQVGAGATFFFTIPAVEIEQQLPSIA